MQNKRWLRYGLGSLTLMGAVGLSSVLVACSDDDEPAPVAPTPDAGDPDPTPDPGTPDAGPDADPPAPTPEPARLQMVNAATDFGTANPPGIVRVCFGAGKTADGITVTPLPALPDQSAVADVPPGVPIGLGGNVTGTGIDLSDLYIQPYVMNGVTLAAKEIVKPGAGDPGVSCAEILAEDFEDKDGNPLVENVDYWKLPVIPANTLLAEKSYLLVLTGCAANATAAPAKCGPGFTADDEPGVGNLKLHIHELDRATTIDDDKTGVQFVHASAAGEAFLASQPGGALKVIPGFTSDKDDTTKFKPITGDGSPGSGPVDLNKATELRQVDGVTFASDSFTANANVPAIALPLTTIQAISFPTGVPDDAKLRNGAAFTFLAVGDPTEPPTVDGKPNPKAFHYLAFPNNPPIAVYKP